MRSDWVVVGRIGAPYGVKGWVKVHSFTEPKENILSFQTWHIQINDVWQEVKLKDVKAHGTGFVAGLVDTEDRDQAIALTNLDIAVSREMLAELDEGEYYWADLIGLEVNNDVGVYLGKIVDIFATGANDVLVVKGDQEHLIPYVFEQYVLDIDVAAKKMKVHWDPEF